MGNFYTSELKRKDPFPVELLPIIPVVGWGYTLGCSSLCLSWVCLNLYKLKPRNKWELKGHVVLQQSENFCTWTSSLCPFSLVRASQSKKKKNRNAAVALILVLMLFVPYYFYPCTKPAYSSELSWATAELSRTKELLLWRRGCFHILRRRAAAKLQMQQE